MNTLKNIKSAYRVVVKGLVCDSSGRVLMVQEHGSGLWDLPGGGLEHGESIEAALRREFREELAAEITINSKRPVVIPTWNTKFNDPVLMIIYNVTVVSEPRTTSEVSEYQYFNLKRLKDVRLDSTLMDEVLKYIYSMGC